MTEHTIVCKDIVPGLAFIKVGAIFTFKGFTYFLVVDKSGEKGNDRLMLVELKTGHCYHQFKVEFYQGEMGIYSERLATRQPVGDLVIFDHVEHNCMIAKEKPNDN